MYPLADIVVLGDMLRPGFDSAPGGVDRQIGWLHLALRRQLTAAAGLPVSCLPASDPQIAALIPALRPTHEALDFWAENFTACPSALAGVLRARLCRSFCVGYEMPPYLTALLDEIGTSYLDLRVHPIRFMDDLLFAARASCDPTRECLAGLAVPRPEVVATAGLREAMLRLAGAPALPPDCLLVLGQQRWDGSQIESGGFLDPETARGTIAKLCAQHAHVLLKPHPGGADGPLLDLVRRLRPDAVTTRENVYRLLAAPEVAHVLSVNSSAGEEAGFFGKPATSLAPPPVRLTWRDEPCDAASHATLDDVFLATDFWRRCLAPHTAVTKLDGVVLPPKPNRLRIALGAFWNYQEIDTDVIPARPQAPPPAPSVRQASRALAAALLGALTSWVL